MNIQRSLDVETNLLFQSNKSDKGVVNSLKALNAIIDLMLLQDGDTILLPQRIRLHHDGNHASICGQRGTGVNSDFFFNCSR